MDTQNPNLAGTTMDKRIERRSRKPLYMAGAAAVIVVVLATWFMSGGAKTSYTLDGQRIRIATVTEGMYEDYIPLRASVEPERSVFLDAIEGGRVERILVEEGALVEQDQPLVELSNTSLQLDVIAREAEGSWNAGQARSASR